MKPLSAHFPHPARPLQDVQRQIMSFQAFVMHESHGLPVISGLDANVEPRSGAEIHANIFGMLFSWMVRGWLS